MARASRSWAIHATAPWKQDAPSPSPAGSQTETPELKQALSARAEDVKEKLAYVARDYDKKMKAARWWLGRSAAGLKPYELPDGQHASIDRETRLRCPEALSQPP